MLISIYTLTLVAPAAHQHLIIVNITLLPVSSLATSYVVGLYV